MQEPTGKHGENAGKSSFCNHRSRDWIEQKSSMEGKSRGKL